ncbi:MAG TPA: 5-formyltetrahydrofolate cyclo-ligase [Spirochaetia bacterium]|nr:5-formyltetrahydrofolate cyclo-ligase [Spirochaetia bacterium]
MEKASLRRSMQDFLARLDPKALAERSRQVADRFQRTAEWKEADWLFSFLSMPGEIQTDALIRAAWQDGKRVAVPRIQNGEIRFLEMPAGAPTPPRDRWGIPVPDPAWPPVEPAAAGSVLVSAPGLAFDRSGNRLGRGKGYYDRFLARARAAGSRLAVIAICFSEQVVDEVPHTEADQPVDGVVTDREAMRCASPHP